MDRINCRIDSRVTEALKRRAFMQNKTMEEVAEDILEQELISDFPGGQRGMHLSDRDFLQDQDYVPLRTLGHRGHPSF